MAWLHTKTVACLRLQGRFPGSTPAVPRYYADTRQVFAYHCVGHSDGLSVSPGSTQYTVRGDGCARACRVYGCHCEERSDMAIRSPCGRTKRKVIFWANTKSTAKSPGQQPTCQVSLRGRGLPHLVAPKSAMLPAGRRPAEEQRSPRAPLPAKGHPFRRPLHWFAMT